MPAADPQRRFHLTPGHCLLALLAVEFLLFLSQWFRWLPKGWPVLDRGGKRGGGGSGDVRVVRRGGGLAAAVPVQHRSLLVLTVVVAVPCSWLAVEMKKAREQMDAVEVSRGFGGVRDL